MSNTIWFNVDESQVDISYLEERFEDKDYNVIKKWVDKDDEETTIELSNKVDVVVSSFEPWNERTLNACRDKVKFIIRYGAGLDNIDIKAATKCGIPVANVPGANSSAVAEVALLHILNVGRRFSQCIEDGRKGKWPATITGNELDGKTVGLVGFGLIAKNLAKKLSGFDVKILAYDIMFDNQTAEQYNVQKAPTMEYVFENSDIVSLHIPLNDSTRESVDMGMLQLMKKSAYLINTCRGGVIKEDDLIEALERNIIKGAGLDVLSFEPPAKDNPLFSMKNVFITTHMGAASIEAECRSQKIIADSIDTFFEGEIPYNVKNMDFIKYRGKKLDE